MASKNRSPVSVSTKADVERFQKAADAWGKKATKSKATARKTLVRLGMLTPSGKLTKRYGG
mgnify:CR=1 FL=1